jgi:glucose/arabinose dehydrogenase
LRKLSVIALLIATLSEQYQPAFADPACVAGVPNLFRRLCAETIIPSDPAVETLESQGIDSISGIAFGPDGSLYFARPATSEIIRLAPDGKGFFAAPQVFASKLPEPPNGLAYDAVSDTWFVSADTTITRLRDTNHDGVADEQQVIVSGLPGGAGGWLGNVRIGPDRRLYVAKASSCDACIESDPRRAALLSFALDGSDMQIVARGLRDSYDFDWNPADGTLYVVDNERPTMPAELNAVRKAGEDFGWPACDSSGMPVPGLAEPDQCAAAASPTIRFDAGSHPTGVSFYRGSAFPPYQGGLLVALSGSWNTPTLAGYEMLFIPFDGGNPGAPVRILPDTPRNTADASLIRTSFYPYHMTAMAISPEGWIYVSIAEGRIYRFRPRNG